MNVDVKARYRYRCEKLLRMQDCSIRRDDSDESKYSYLCVVTRNIWAEVTQGAQPNFTAGKIAKGW